MDRSQRFTEVTPGSRVVSLKTSMPPPPAYKKTELGIGGAKAGTVKGTSLELERPYMRLHWLPDPATVRPAPVLHKALGLVKQKWVSRPDYAHANDQLMAIQQDCKLQGITGNIACDAFGDRVPPSCMLSRPAASLLSLAQSYFCGGSLKSFSCFLTFYSSLDRGLAAESLS